MKKMDLDSVSGKVNMTHEFMRLKWGRILFMTGQLC